MTQHFDAAADRRQLESDRDRVQGRIEGEREKDMAILEALERDLAEIEAALQRLDESVDTTPS